LSLIKTFIYIFLLGTAAHAAQSIQVGEALGDFDGDGRRDSAVLLQDHRVWQIVVNCGNGRKVLVDQDDREPRRAGDTAHIGAGSRGQPAGLVLPVERTLIQRCLRSGAGAFAPLGTK
jgi:hypothetical protein